MSGQALGESPEAGGGDHVMGLMKNLGPSEILEVLSGGEGFCQHCLSLLHSRVQSLVTKKFGELSVSNHNGEGCEEFWSATSASKRSTSWSSSQTPESVNSGRQKTFLDSSPTSDGSKQPPLSQSGSEILLNDGLSTGVSSSPHNGLSEVQKEQIRFSQVVRKKDFVHIERIHGKATNVLQGLELHTRVFNAEEQKKIVEYVYDLQRKGQSGQLRARTYSEPNKWMRGKGRVTIQFGCCYNYAVDKNGNPPGIIRDEEVDPLPPLFKQMIKRMVRWHVLPPTCVPNSCIVNIYNIGDCIPPHIDHHDFLRPFCTLSFLAECKILFGGNLKIVSPGEFSGPIFLPLPVGSVLILNGNGADVAKHCVPGVPAKRISITFRKMDESKIPYNYSPNPELVGIKPLVYSPATNSSVQQGKQHENKQQIDNQREPAKTTTETVNNSLFNEKDDFPPLGSSSHGNKQRAGRSRQ